MSAPPNILYWTWSQESKGIKTFRAACLSPEVFCFQKFKATKALNQISEKLQSGEPPTVAFGAKASVIPLDTIERITRSDANKETIVCYHTADGEQCLRVHAPDGTRYVELFEALRKQLAPGVEPIATPLPVSQAIRVPVFSGIFCLLLGGLLVALAFMAEPDYDAMGRKAGQKEMLNDALLAVGPTGAIVILAVVLAGFAGWAFWRAKYPPTAATIHVNQA